MTQKPSRAGAAASAVARAVIPVALAIVVGGFIILAMGKDPFTFYGKIFQYGLTGTNWMRSLVLMAPLLVIAVGLIVAFRGQLWNLGYGGQFLLGAVVVSGLGPAVFASVPGALGTIVLLLSTDLDELVELSNRIAVISTGRIVGIVENEGPGTAERVGQYMTGAIEGSD